MAITMDLFDYFRMRCSDLLVVSRDIWQMRNLMAQEVKHPRLREILSGHNEPTRRQISNLEQVVDRLGGITGPEENPITLGMLRAHRQFLELSPPQPLIDINDALESDKIVHMITSGYLGLIAIARELGERDILQLLEENFSDEETLRARLEEDLPALLAEIRGQMRKAA